MKYCSILKAFSGNGGLIESFFLSRQNDKDVKEEQSTLNNFTYKIDSKNVFYSFKA